MNQRIILYEQVQEEYDQFFQELLQSDEEIIMATVDVLVPNSCLSNQEVKEVRKLEEEIDRIRKEEASIRLKYDRAKIAPLSPLEQVRLNLLYGLESLKQAKEIKIDNIYKFAAVREKIVPVDYFCNTEIIL